MRKTLAVAFLAGVAVLAVAPAAQAHNYLISSTPSADDTLTELPQQFIITTNDNLLKLDGQTGGFALQVVDAAGLHYESGCVDVAGPAMTMDDPLLGAAGDYTVLWQVVSADGHTVSGEIPFTWAPPDGSAAATGSPTAPQCGEEPAATSGATPPPASAPPAAETPATIRLSDVLWVGGAVLAAGIAAAVAILVLSRRRRS
jgi:methionine-rich copper-binding protein CopC